MSWKGWKSVFNAENKNYLRTDFPQVVVSALKKVEEQENYKHIEAIVVDTLNGLMVADEMRRTKEKGYDKWQDLAQSIYDLVDYSLTMREGVTVIFTAHTQTDHDEGGYLFTRIKTSGRKLDKITLESKFSTVLLSKCVDGKYTFETQANFSTAKSPMGAFEEKEVENDITKIIKALEEF